MLHRLTVLLLAICRPILLGGPLPIHRPPPILLIDRLPVSGGIATLLRVALLSSILLLLGILLLVNLRLVCVNCPGL